MFKTAIATAILGLGVLGAYFVIQNTDINAELALKNETTNLPKNSPFVENLNNNPDPQKSDAVPASETVTISNNLTDNFINGLKQDIVQNNLDNNSGNLVVSDPDQITNELLTDAVKKFSAERSKSAVDESRIKISSDNSKNSIISYVNKFEEIISKSAQKIGTGAVPADPDPEELRPMLAGYDFAIESFYNTAVPSSALTFHKKEIEILFRKKRALEELINYKVDPLASILASKELSGIQNEFDSLTEQFNKFLKTI